MEKETVLEIEFQPIWDKWAWRIIKQNETILKRGKFEDKGVGVYSYNYPHYNYYNCILGIRGNNEDKDNIINLCTEDEKREIEVKVKNINKKYGIMKRWRGKERGTFFYINSQFRCKTEKEFNSLCDTRKYEIGNYFKTEEEAEEYAKYMEKCSLEWHEKRENNE